MSRRRRHIGHRIGFRFIGNYVCKPVPVYFSINHYSWDPRVEYEEVKHANGKPVRVNNLKRDYRAGACLTNLQIQTEDSCFVVCCDNISFNCMSPNANKPTEDKIQKCLERMRKGKCQYSRLARQIFTNIPR